MTDSWVTESRAEQGLPPKVEDAEVLRRVGVLIRQDEGARKAS